MILPDHTSVDLDRSTGGQCLIQLGTKRTFLPPRCLDRNAYAERLWYTPACHGAYYSNAGALPREDGEHLA